MDDLDLMLIEQPLDYDDIVDHAVLQAQLHTAICLDESIRWRAVPRARWALDIRACRVINRASARRRARVGGLTSAIQIHDLCAERGVPVWCRGMLETNVGRALNVALARCACPAPLGRPHARRAARIRRGPPLPRGHRSAAFSCAQPRLDAQRAAGARSGRHPRSVPDRLAAARQRVHTIGIATR